MYYNIKDDDVPMAAEPPAVFPAESRLIYAGTGRSPGLPAAPPPTPASIYVSPGSPPPGRGHGLLLSFETDIDQALEVP